MEVSNSISSPLTSLVDTCSSSQQIAQPTRLEQEPSSPARSNELATAESIEESHVVVRAPVRHPKAAARTYGRRPVDNPEDAQSVIKSRFTDDRPNTAFAPVEDIAFKDSAYDASQELEDDSVTRAGPVETVESSSSSPQRTNHSTDPTTDEEDAVTGRAERSSSEAATAKELKVDRETATGVERFLRKSAADEMREIDEMFGREENETPTRATTTVTRDDMLPAADETPVARHISAPPQLSGSDSEEDEQVQVFARRKRPRRAVESDEDEDLGREAGATAEAQRLSSIQDASDDVNSEKALRKQRLEKLARSKQIIEPPAAKTRQVSMAPSEDEDGEAQRDKSVTAKAKKQKQKRSSFPTEADVAKKKAADDRKRGVKLQPACKVLDWKKAFAAAPAPQSQKNAESAPTADVDTITISSTDPIENDSSPKRKQPSPIAARPDVSKMMLPPRHSSHQHEPIPRVTLKGGKSSTTPALPRSSSSDEDDGELLSLDQQRADAAKKRSREEFEAKKKQLAAARQKTVRSDSDSDDGFEIVGGPAAKRRPTSRFDRGRSMSVIPSPGRTRPLNAGEQVLHALGGPRAQHIGHNHAAEDTSDSQFEKAARTFGQNLRPSQQHVPAGKRKTLKKDIEQPDLNKTITDKWKFQLAREAQEKRDRVARAQQEARRVAEEQTNAPKPADAVLAVRNRKNQENKDEDDDDDDDLDANYNDDLGSGDEQDRRGSDSDAESGKGSTQGNAMDVDGGDDDDDDEVETARPRVPQRSHARPAIIDEESDAEDDTRASSLGSAPAPTELVNSEGVPTAPARVASPLPEGERFAFGLLADSNNDGEPGDGAGFSQFFNSQFSQDAGLTTQTDGFQRNNKRDAAPAPTLFGHVFLNDEERAEDAELLAQRGAFNAANAPATPFVPQAPRVYINKEGLMTQTRPAGLYDLSQTDTPISQRPAGMSLSSGPGADTQRDIAMTQTQLDASETPSHHSMQHSFKDPSRRRLGANMTEMYGGSPSAFAAREREEQEEDDLQETQDMSMGSAAEDDVARASASRTERSSPAAADASPDAQPSRPMNAFDALRAGADRAARRSRSPSVTAAGKPPAKGKNQFIAGEAEMDEEEEGAFGGQSGDEDETGMDAELEELVDRGPVDLEEQARQDRLARDLQREHADQEDEANLAIARKAAAGDLRKNDSFGLGDEDQWDDEFRESVRIAQKAKIGENAAELLANETTRSFGLTMVPSNENQSQQLDWLQAPDEDQDRDSASDEDMDVDDGEQGGPAQRLANEDVSENEEAPKSRRDIVRLAQRMKAEREENERRNKELEQEELRRQDSSPQAKLKIKQKSANRSTGSHGLPLLGSRPGAEDFSNLDGGSLFGKRHNTVIYGFKDTSRLTSGGGGENHNGRSLGAKASVVQQATSKTVKRDASSNSLAGSKSQLGQGGVKPKDKSLKTSGSLSTFRSRSGFKGFEA